MAPFITGAGGDQASRVRNEGQTGWLSRGVSKAWSSRKRCLIALVGDVVFSISGGGLKPTPDRVAPVFDGSRAVSAGHAEPFSGTPLATAGVFALVDFSAESLKSRGDRSVSAPKPAAYRRLRSLYLLANNRRPPTGDRLCKSANAARL